MARNNKRGRRKSKINDGSVPEHDKANKTTKTRQKNTTKPTQKANDKGPDLIEATKSKKTMRLTKVKNRRGNKQKEVNSTEENFLEDSDIADSINQRATVETAVRHNTR